MNFAPKTLCNFALACIMFPKLWHDDVMFLKCVFAGLQIGFLVGAAKQLPRTNMDPRSVAKLSSFSRVKY